MSGALQFQFRPTQLIQVSLEVRITRGSDVPGGANPTLFHRVDNVRQQYGLRASANSLDLAPASDLTFQLDTGLLFGGSFYWILGSVTGTKPGIDFDLFTHLPLNFVPYMGMTLGQPLNPVFQDFIGFLDADSQATAVFRYPGGLDPEFVGVVLHHSFVLAPNIRDPVFFASNAVATQIQ